MKQEMKHQTQSIQPEIKEEINQQDRKKLMMTLRKEYNAFRDNLTEQQKKKHFELISQINALKASDYDLMKQLFTELKELIEKDK